MDRQEGELRDLLMKLTPEQVKGFDDWFHSRMIEAYTWDLWGAATLLSGDYCSDDAFSDFRSWLISMGRPVYEGALADPESLANAAHAPGVEDIFFEGFQYVSSQVYEERTGEEFTEYTDSYPEDPVGTKWWESAQDVQQKYPRLGASAKA